MPDETPLHSKIFGSHRHQGCAVRLGLFAICALAGVAPAKCASRLDPMQALREE